MKLRLIFTVFSLLSSQSVYALNNNTYTQITQMNSWVIENDVYVVEQHVCEGTNKNLYKLPKTNDHQFSLLLAAFSAELRVRLNYECGENGYPEIKGVRVER